MICQDFVSAPEVDIEKGLLECIDVGAGGTGGTCPPTKDFAINKEVSSYLSENAPFSYGKCALKYRAPPTF